MPSSTSDFLARVAEIMGAPRPNFRWLGNGDGNLAQAHVLPSSGTYRLSWMVGMWAPTFSPTPGSGLRGRLLVGTAVVQATMIDRMPLADGSVGHMLLTNGIEALKRELGLQLHSLKTLGRMTPPHADIPDWVAIAEIEDFGDLPTPRCVLNTTSKPNLQPRLSGLASLVSFPMTESERERYLRVVGGRLPEPALMAGTVPVEDILAMDLIARDTVRVDLIREASRIEAAAGDERSIIVDTIDCPRCAEKIGPRDIPVGRTTVVCWRCGWAPKEEPCAP